MIGSINGKIIRIDGVTVLIEASGVGYEVDMPVLCMNDFTAGKTVFVYTHHVVREDAQVLYGFNTFEQRALFRELIKINGVGPKMALAVLSTFTVEDFVQTVLAEQSTALEQIPGVGKKTAQRMMVDLKDSIKKFADNTQQVLTPATATTTNAEAFHDAIAALSALGYREADAIKTVKLVLKEHSDFNTQDLIKAALALISKR